MKPLKYRFLWVVTRSRSWRERERSGAGRRRLCTTRVLRAPSSRAPPRGTPLPMPSHWSALLLNTCAKFRGINFSNIPNLRSYTYGVFAKILIIYDFQEKSKNGRNYYIVWVENVVSFNWGRCKSEMWKRFLGEGLGIWL